MIEEKQKQEKDLLRYIIAELQSVAGNVEYAKFHNLPFDYKTKAKTLLKEIKKRIV